MNKKQRFLETTIVALSSIVFLRGMYVEGKTKTTEATRQSEVIMATESIEHQKVIEICYDSQFKVTNAMLYMSKAIVVLNESICVTTEETEKQEEESYKSLDEVIISKDMRMNETLCISKEDFKKLLTNLEYDYEGFYEKNSDVIWETCQEFQVNELFVCGIFAIESLWGSNSLHITKHNYGSIMKNRTTMVDYETDEQGIRENVALLAEKYLNPEGKYYCEGATIAEIGAIYCPPNPNWADEVYRCMKMILENR